MAAKRVFPPEWYAAQAARRKQRAEEKASSGTKKTSSSKSSASKRAAISKIHTVKLEEASLNGTKIGHIEFSRSRGKGTKKTFYREGDVSPHSIARLKRVLAARKAAGKGSVKTKNSPFGLIGNYTSWSSNKK